MNTVTDTKLSSGVSNAAETRFSIVSRAKSTEDKLLVITANHDDKVVVKTPEGIGEPNQIWIKKIAFLDHKDYYYLVNPATQKCIKRENLNQGGLLHLVPYKFGMQEDLAIWRDDSSNVPTAIQSYRDSEQKINIPGDGPKYATDTQLVTWEWSKGQPNELWTFTLEP